jgi:hypothetical protein
MGIPSWIEHSSARHHVAPTARAMTFSEVQPFDLILVHRTMWETMEGYGFEMEPMAAVLTQ